MFRRVIIFEIFFLICSLAKGADDRNAPSLKAQKKYENIISAEKAKSSQTTYIENLSAGIAATTIGFYGYYFDNRGVLAKVAYSLTQTVGIIVISDATYDRTKPSFLLIADKYLQKRESMDYDDYMRAVVNTQIREEYATTKQTAITTGILALI